MFDNKRVKGSEFYRKVKALARHKELGPGLLSDMLKQLAIGKEDL